MNYAPLGLGIFIGPNIQYKLQEKISEIDTFLLIDNNRAYAEPA